MNNGQRNLLVDVGPEGDWLVDSRSRERAGARGQTHSRPASGGSGLSKEKNQFGSEFPVMSKALPAPNAATPLPQSDERTWREARPDDAVNNAQLNPAEENEQIGPVQPEGGRLWFGKTFYNSEDPLAWAASAISISPAGNTGSTRRRRSGDGLVSAILVEPGAVWLGLFPARRSTRRYRGGLAAVEPRDGTGALFRRPPLVTSIGRPRRGPVHGRDGWPAVLRDDRIRELFHRPYHHRTLSHRATEVNARQAR